LFKKNVVFLVFLQYISFNFVFVFLSYIFFIIIVIEIILLLMIFNVVIFGNIINFSDVVWFFLCDFLYVLII